MTKQPAAARTPEELIGLLSAVASAILAVIIVATLYFGREIFVPVALYSVRRLRRKLPNATIMLGCWSAGNNAAALEHLGEAAKADIVAGSLREATRLCVELARHVPADLPMSVTAA